MFMEAQKKRYYLVDGIRGVAIVNMAVFHFLYDVFIVYGKNPFWYGLPAIHVWQQMICQTFIVCIVGLKPSPLGETFR